MPKVSTMKVDRLRAIAEAVYEHLKGTLAEDVVVLRCEDFDAIYKAAFGVRLYAKSRPDPASEAEVFRADMAIFQAAEQILAARHEMTFHFASGEPTRARALVMNILRELWPAEPDVVTVTTTREEVGEPSPETSGT